jgi:hypothetical protein
MPDTFHPLLTDPLRSIFLMHCTLTASGSLTAAVAVVDASVTSDHARLQAVADESHAVYDVTLPPQMVGRGCRYKAFQAQMGYHQLPSP